MKTSTTTATLLAALSLLLASATLRAQSPPANDSFANRQSIPSKTIVEVTGTTVGATQEAFEVANAGSSPAGESINETKTVWYDYVPPVSGLLNIDIARTTSRGLTYALLFEGATPDLAHLIDQGYLPSYSDGDGFSPPGLIHVVAGQEYTLSLGNTNYPGAFTLTLTLTPSATPTPTPMPMPVASVTAKGKADRSTGTPGKFVVSLSAAANADVTVAYKTSGSAVNGTDYKLLPGTLIVPAGKTSATLKVKPRVAIGPAESTVAVKVKLEAGDGYTVGSAATAKVKIYDQN